MQQNSYKKIYELREFSSYLEPEWAFDKAVAVTTVVFCDLDAVPNLATLSKRKKK